MLRRHLPSDGFAPIIVQRGMSGPITLYKRGAGNEYVVKLDTADRAWAQCAFQFAHEFCHIMSNYRDVQNSQLWFEETLCECASLFALRQMAVEWKTNPPYPNWSGYSVALADYAQQRINKYPDNDQSLRKFFSEHQSQLVSDGTNRKLNTWMAVRLLPHFEESPGGWEAVRYLNLGPVDENQTFDSYLTGWYQRVPRTQRGFVKKIADAFGIEVKQTQTTP